MTTSGLIVPEAYEPPSLAQLQEWQTPIRWEDALLNDSKEDIARKREYATALVGIAAIYFMPDEVKARMSDMAKLEHARLYALQQFGRERERLNIGIMGGAAPFTGYTFLEIASMTPFVHPFLGYVRKNNYDSDLAETADKKEVRDIISAKELVGVLEFVYYDDVGETGNTMSEVDQHMLQRWLEMNPGVSPTLLRRSGRWVCRKDIEQTGQIESTLGTEDNTYGFVIAQPWGTLTGMDTDGKYRWQLGLALSATQLESNRPNVEATLEILGDRSILKADEFNWIVPKK